MKVQVTAVNRDEGYICFDEIENWDICETTSEVYHVALKEYGRCTSKIYVDKKDGKAKHIGWVFERKRLYEDTREPYISVTWIVPLKSYEIRRIVEYAL